MLKYRVTLKTFPALLFTAAMIAGAQSDSPQTTKRPDPKPDLVNGRVPRTPAPNLAAATTFQAVDAFVNWASASSAQQSDEVRRTIAAASGSAVVVRILCDQIGTAPKVDHARTLVQLSVLGEMKSTAAAACLTRFVQLPFPTTGTMVEGEILEQTALGTLQAKAIDGLAFQRTAESDRVVLEAVARHPSRIVRAEAINAYLWNHGDTAEARAAVNRVVRADEKIFVDRPRRLPDQDDRDFNARLSEYLRAHPEAAAPAPAASRVAEDQKRERPVTTLPDAPK